MAAKASGDGRAAAAARSGTLSEAATAPVEAAKRSEPVPSATVVAEAVRRRAAGESFAAIGRALGVQPRRVSSWCRAAAPETVVRRPRATTRSKPVSIRLPLELHRAVLQRASDEVITKSLLEVIELGLRRSRGAGAAVPDSTRRALSAELIAASNAVSSFESQLRAAGRLLNQIARYLGTYRELPVSITDELAAVRESVDKLAAGIAELRAAVDRAVA
ncbi:hypothetical protein [Tsukamurella sp. USMM236]|uniref:hypothetical protein n=1 Tax=Tsukamurella sp. USMM236 TaxID=3081301 RepID=UPI00301960A7